MTSSITWPLPDELPKPSGKCIHDRILVLEDCIDCDALAKGVQLEDLDALAAVAVCTPSLDASDALDVLADALLEKGLVHVATFKPGGRPRARRRRERFAADELRRVTWAWARERTWKGPAFYDGTRLNFTFNGQRFEGVTSYSVAEHFEAVTLESIARDYAAIRDSYPDSSMEVAQGRDLDRYASIMFGIARRTCVSSFGFDGPVYESEPDEELRARCRAALSSAVFGRAASTYVPPRPTPIGYVMNTRLEGDTLFADVAVTPHGYVPRLEIEARYASGRIPVDVPHPFLGFNVRDPGANRVPTNADNPGNDDETP